MKLNRVVFSLLFGLIIFAASWLPMGTAPASAMPAVNPLGFSLFTPADSVDDTSAFKLLKSEVMPRLSEILTPRQQELFRDSIADGESFRKTFRSLMLTPDQKRQIKSVINTIPRKDAFAALTPVEKKRAFLEEKKKSSCLLLKKSSTKLKPSNQKALAFLMQLKTKSRKVSK